MKASLLRSRATRWVGVAVLLVLLPAAAAAQPPAGCSWEGDPALRYGWNYLEGLVYHQPGPDYATLYPGQTITRTLGPYNASPIWLPGTCKATDTLCFHAASKSGWALAGDPSFGTPYELPSGYIWYQDVDITAPCSADVGDVDTIVAICAYANNAGICDPSCGDCNEPNTRPADGLLYYSKDTLVVTIVAPPATVSVLQDTLTLVDSGQTAAYIPFSICNENPCAPPTAISYSIFGCGHIPLTVPASSVEIGGGDCKDVYAILDAGFSPSVVACTYDTLTIIVWSETSYDTCVQVVHVIEVCCIPLLSPPVIALLVAALVVAAWIFMKRRSKARN